MEFLLGGENVNPGYKFGIKLEKYLKLSKTNKMNDV
jgi:hypothetical protein